MISTKQPKQIIIFPAFVRWLQTVPPPGEYSYCEWPNFQVQIHPEKATPDQLALIKDKENPSLVYYEAGASLGPGHIEFKKVEILSNGLVRVFDNSLTRVSE